MRTRCSCWRRVTWKIIYESDEQSSKGKGPISLQPNIPVPWSINSGAGHSEPSRSHWETMKEDWWGKPVSSFQREESMPSVSGRNFANPTPACSVAQSCPTLWNPCSPIGSSVHGISQTRIYWSGLPFPPPGDLPNPGIESASPVSPALQPDSSPTE